MTQVRKFTGLAFASLAGAALVSWFGAGLVAMWLGPAWFSAQLHERAGIDAAIGSLRTDFFHAVSFRDIVLSSPVRGTVDEVRVSFRPWDLFSMRARRRQIFAVTLRHPVLTVDAARFSTGSTLRTTPLRLVPFGATVENGSLTVKTPGRDWDVSSLNGYGRITPFRLEVDAEGNVNDWGILRAHLRAGTGAPRNWEFRLDSDRLAAATALALAPPRVVDRVGQLTGDVRLNATVRGAFPQRLQVSDWRVGATAINVAWLPPGQRAPLPVSGSVGVTKQKVSLDDFRVARTTVNGAVAPPWNAPRLDFKVTADHQPLPPFLLALFPDRLGFLDGSVSGTGSIAGTAPNPRAQFNLEGDVRVGALHLPHASGTASLNDGTVLAAVDIASGHLQIHGASVTSAPRWDVEAERLALGDVAQSNGWKNVGGTVNGRFGYDAVNAAASGEFNAEGLRWGRIRMSGRHQATLRLAHGRLDATGDNGGLVLSAASSAEGINVTDFRFSVGGGTMTAAGAYARKNRAIDFTAHAVDLPLSLWPPLVDRYPDATGGLSANGSIHGTLDRPESEWEVRVDRARLRPASGDSTVRGKISTVGSHVRFGDGDVDGTIALSGQVDTVSRAWSLDARLDEASPQLLADLARSSETVTGSISGFLTAAGGDRDVAASSFTWSTGHFGNFYFDELAAGGRRDGDLVRIEQASVIRGPQALRGQATFRRGRGAWSFDAVAQVQQWTAGAAKLDGEIGAEGTVAPDTKSVKATVTAPVFWVADRRLEALSAEVVASPAGAHMSATAGDDQLSLEASLDKALALRGHLIAHDLPLEDLFAPDRAKADEPVPAGLYDADVTLSGTAYAPEADARLAVRGGVWREEKFSATSTVHLSTGGVLLQEAAVDLEAGGHISARGAVASGKDGALVLDGEAQAVSVQAIFHLLDWPVTWSGTTDGTFSIARDTAGVSADIRFDGEHDGFAAVKEGGDFHGRVVGRGNEWSLLGIHVEAGDGHLDVNDRSRLYVDRNGGGTFQVLADVRNIQTGPITYFGGAEVVGRWRAPDPGGNGGHPVDLDVFARSLFINQFVLDGNVAHLAIANQKLVFSPIPGSGQQIGGTLSYAKYPDLLVDGLRFLENGVERVALNGNVGTRTWDFSLATHGLDAGIVRGLLDFQPSMSGAMNIELKAQGSPSEPLVQSRVAWTNGRLGVLPLDSAEAKVNYAKGELSVTDGVAQRRRGYLAQGDARFGIGEAGDKVPMEINLRIDKGDLAMLADMIPEVSKARGSFDGRIRVGGSAGNAAISGYLNARKFSLNSAHLPDVSKGEMRIRIERNRLNIDRAVARVGQGQLQASGFVDFHNGLPSRYDVALRSGRDHGVSIRVPELDIAPGPVLGRFNLLKKSLSGVSRGDPVIDLALKGPADAPTISGEVLLENAVFTYPPAGGRGGTTGTTRALLSHINWDVNLRAGRRCWYQNELVDANVTGALAFEGPTRDLGVKGRIDATQGSIVYSGNEFRIKDAALEVETEKEALSDVKQTTVYLKATAEREVFYTDALNNSNQDIIVMVVDRAPIGEIQPRFFAKNNPGLSSQRALQLALGLPFNDNIDANSLLPDQRARISENANNDQLLRLGLVQLLDSNLASPLARALARRTGLVDYIRVSYQQNDPHSEDGGSVVDQTNNNNATQNEFLKYAKGTQVKFGRGLGSRLYADYSFRVEEFESQLNLRHEVELAYRVHRNLFLRGTTELDAQRELGRPPDRRAILENQWRFGLPRRRPSKPASSASQTAADKSAG